MEPTVVMWRMERAGGLRAHAVIGYEGQQAWVMWCVNDKPLGVRAFSDWTSALQWSEQLKAQNWAAGWRLSADASVRLSPPTPEH